MVNMKNESGKVRIFWEEFLKSTGRSETTECFEVFHFELTEKVANELLRLVLIGQKKATASSLWSYEIRGEKLPKVGDLSVVTDWEGSPKCVIETTSVAIIPFSEITYDICKREGEDNWNHGVKDILNILLKKVNIQVMILRKTCLLFLKILK